MDEEMLDSLDLQLTERGININYKEKYEKYKDK